MGSCSSSLSEVQREDLNLSKQVDILMRKSQDKVKKIVRVLLLGAGDSGKSTVSSLEFKNYLSE